MVLWRISGESTLPVEVHIQVLEAQNRQAKEPAEQKTGVKFSVLIVDRQSGLVSDASLPSDGSAEPGADLSAALFDLREIGPAAKKAKPPLEELLRQNKVSGADRLMVAMTLAALDPDNPGAARRFARLLSEADSGSAADALGSLKEMGSRAKWAVPILKPMLKDADEARRTAAADALKAVQSGETATGN
jgi:hypothetical protein